MDFGARFCLSAKIGTRRRARGWATIERSKGAHVKAGLRQVTRREALATALLACSSLSACSLPTAIEQLLGASSSDASDADETADAAGILAVADEPLPSSGAEPSDWDGDTSFLSDPGFAASVDVNVDAGSIILSPLDDLGRPGRAIGRITISLLSESANWRSSFAYDAYPAGWPHSNAPIQVHLTDDVTLEDHPWNRCHIIADSLGGYLHVYGEDGTLDMEASVTPVENLVTGTRCMNVGADDEGGLGYGGMEAFEGEVISYVYGASEASVWYSVEPLYVGSELIPRSMLMQAVSNDGGLSLCREAHNVIPGYSIDYYTGEIAESLDALIDDLGTLLD